jgi:hypothetical protein
MPEAEVLDLSAYKARLPDEGAGGFDEAFL